MLNLIVKDKTDGTFTHFGEDLFVVLLLMLHPAQELEPPANPERFTSLFRWSAMQDRHILATDKNPLSR
jgi:hypothetical protein